MKIAFPVRKDDGIDSAVYNHFGSAPFFLVLDLHTDALEVFENPDPDHQHGVCSPMTALGGRKVDGVVVGGIGGGALKKLNNEGITVYRAIEGTAKENASLIKAGNLPIFDPGQTCGHHHGVQIGEGAH